MVEIMTCMQALELQRENFKKLKHCRLYKTS